MVAPARTNAIRHPRLGLAEKSVVERYARNALDAEAGEQLGFWGSQARMYLGAVLIATGNKNEGRELFARGHAAYLSAGAHTGAALMLAFAASAEVIAGDLDRAAVHLAAAEGELARGERWPVPYVLLAKADLAEAFGESTSMVAELRREAEFVATRQGAVAAADRARAALAGEWWSIATQPSSVANTSGMSSIA